MGKKNTSLSDFKPIAVIGVGAMFPGSTDAEGFWKDIISGKDLITDIPPTHWLVEDYFDPDPKTIDKTYGKRGAFLKNYPFDPLEYGIPPNIIPATDTSQLLALVVAKEVLEDATFGKYQETDLSRVSVILGGAALEALQYVAGRMQRPVWVKALREFGLPETSVQKICDKISNSYTPWQENTFPGLLGNVVAGRIANRFNLGGTNCITDAACASSLAALSMSISELQQGSAEIVITGGVDTLNDIIMFMCFSKTQALSLSNDCRPFSDKADGTLLGEGLGMFALKRLTDAERDNNHIYAVIRGVGSSSDGRAKSIYAPVAKGQTQAVLRAYEMAGYGPATVGMIEAHGTGTKAGDQAEFEGLSLAFKETGVTQTQFCALGSIKSQIGHTKSAAGAAGLFKAIMALHHNVFPPTIKIEKPNPAFHIEQSPFYLNTQLRPWISNDLFPRRAGVSSFGFGGSNFHIAIEEYKGKNKAPRLRASPTELVLFTANDPAALLASCEKYLAESNVNSLPDLAHASQENFNEVHLARLAIVAADKDDLRQKLQEALAAIKTAPEKSIALSKGIYYGSAVNPGKVAFVFPGQGSQYLGMGRDLTAAFSIAFDEWNKELADVVFPIPVFTPEEREKQQQQLNATQWTQPALAVTSLALLKIMQALEIYPDSVAGHSFGELTALYTAGVMDRDSLLKVAKKRGELMHEAGMITKGSMLSVSHPTATVLKLLDEWKLPVTPANFNSPTQLVLSGPTEAIADVEQRLKAQGIQSRRLAVDTAFHSPIVAGSSQPFLQFLKAIDFKAPKIPVYANSTAESYPTDTKQIKNYLAEQLAKPVRFQALIENMYQTGVRTFIEVGPQTILSSLIHKTLDKQEHNVIPLDHKNEHGLTSLWNGLGKLVTLGLNPKFSALWQEYRPMKQKSVGPEPKYTMLISGTNYGRPYPPAGGFKDLPKPIEEQVIQPVVEAPKIIPHPIINKSSGTPALVQSKIENTSSTLMRKKTMSENNLTLIQIVQAMQKQLVDAHNAYQDTMSKSHMEFIKSISQMTQQILSGANTFTATQSPSIQPESVVEMQPASSPQPVAVAPQPAVAPPAYVAPQPAPPPPKPAAPSQAMQPPPAMVQPPRAAPPIPQPIAAPQPQAAPAAPIAQASVQSTVAPTPTPASVAPAPVAAAATVTKDGIDLQKLLLDVVVEKTGYPAEMLTMDMSIETDLGIDSIKRVEILSTLSERAPNLPEISPGDLAELKTLGDIVAHIKKRLAS